MKKQKKSRQSLKTNSLVHPDRGVSFNFTFLLTSLFLFSCFITSCEKTDYKQAQEQAMADAMKKEANATDLTNPVKEHPFLKAVYKKYITLTELADPVWVYPETGKEYTDFLDFARDYFPWTIDDAEEFVPDSSINSGFIFTYNGKYRYDPTQPYKDPLVLRYRFDEKTDSLYLIGITDAYGNITTLPTKVLELTTYKMVLRFVQIIPFTYTTNTITWTYQWDPLYDKKYRNAAPVYYTQDGRIPNGLHNSDIPFAGIKRNL